MYAEDMVQMDAGSLVTTSVSVSLYEPCLAVSVGPVLLVSWIPF